jgi:hypothetical protein
LSRANHEAFDLALFSIGFTRRFPGPVRINSAYNPLHVVKRIANARGHGRGHTAKAFMLAAEIVPNEIKRKTGQWFSNFLLNAFVKRVNRRIDMRMVRF